MSKYTSYARALDEAFRSAREKYGALVAALDSAQAAFDSANRWYPETYNGEREAKKARAHAALIEAQGALQRRGAAIWEEFAARRDQIGRELSAAVKSGNMAKPEEIDAAGLELLKSGVLSGEEMQELAKKYDDNPTMLKLIAKYAIDRTSDAGLDATERGMMYAIADRCRTGRGAVMSNWEQLVTLANYHSGGGADGMRKREPHHAVTLAAEWENIGGSFIEQF